MKNKLLSILLAVTIVFTTVAIMSIPVAATGTSLSVSKVSEDANTVKVAINISGNTGLSGLGATLNYDGAALELQSVDSAGITSAAGMPVFEGGHGDGTVSITVINSNSGEGTKENGTVCIATFKKLDAVKNGGTTNVSVSVDNDMTFDTEDNPLAVSGGSAEIKLSAVPTTKPATTKPATTKAPVKPTQKPIANNGAVPTIEETTEETTEELTLDPNDLTEYESYEYEEVEKEDDNEDEDKSQMIKRIIAIAVIVLCVGAVVVLLLTRKKS